MQKTNPNDSAYPTKKKIVFESDHPMLDDTVRYEPIPGLTKREHFAGLALQGIMSSPNSEGIDETTLCNMAVIFADELIKSLNQ